MADGLTEPLSELLHCTLAYHTVGQPLVADSTESERKVLVLYAEAHQCVVVAYTLDVPHRLPRVVEVCEAALATGVLLQVQLVEHTDVLGEDYLLVLDW